MFTLVLLLGIAEEDLYNKLFTVIGFCKVRIVLLRVGRSVVVSDGLSPSPPFFSLSSILLSLSKKSILLNSFIIFLYYK